MLSLRSLGRTAPRTMRALSTQSARATIRPALQTPSAFSRTAPSTVLRSAFSTSRLQRGPTDMTTTSESIVNQELVAKLESELEVEREMRDPDNFPAHLQEYLDNSPFQLKDTPGNEEIVLTRKFGDESIKIVFTIDDLNNVDEDADAMQEENAMNDEMEDEADMDVAGGAGSKRKAQSHEDSNEETDLADQEPAQGDREEPSFPSRCYISVERPNKGMLQIHAVAQDGMFSIENVFWYSDAKYFDPKSRPDELHARDLYNGPPFGNLDEDLQLLFERFLEERDINTTLALFVPEYIDFKEQREYLRWLSNVKNFVQ